MLHLHQHQGYYNPDYPHDTYSDKDFDIDVPHGTVTMTHNHNDSSYRYDPQTETIVSPFATMPDALQNEIIAVLEPLISTANKYPHLSRFQYFSRKHEMLIRGRVAKAAKLADSYLWRTGSNDVYGYVFILPASGIAYEIWIADRGHWTILIHQLTETTEE